MAGSPWAQIRSTELRTENGHARYSRTGVTRNAARYRARIVCSICQRFSLALLELVAPLGELGGDGGIGFARRLEIGGAAGGIAALHARHGPAVQRGCLVGVDLQRRRIVGDGLGVFALLEIDEAAAVERLDMAGRQAQRLVAVAQRTVELLQYGAVPAQAVPAVGEPLVGRDGHARFLRGAGVLLALREDHRAVGVGLRVSRLKLDRLVVVGQRRTGLALALVHHAAVVPGLGEFRVELDGAVEILQRAVELIERDIGVGAVAVDRRILRRQRDGLVEILQRALELLLAVE